MREVPNVAVCIACLYAFVIKPGDDDEVCEECTPLLARCPDTYPEGWGELYNSEDTNDD